MGQTVDDSALDKLFREARTYTTWQTQPVDDRTLQDLYELLKWAPTQGIAASFRNLALIHLGFLAAGRTISKWQGASAPPTV
jgi:hypothetical protein